MKDTKTTDAQKKASRAWEDRNIEKTRVDGYRRTAKSFIRNHATLENLDELETLIAERRKQLDE